MLTKSQVLDSLKTFFPHISARDVKTLVGPGNMSVDKLRNLIFKTETPAVSCTNLVRSAYFPTFLMPPMGKRLPLTLMRLSHRVQSETLDANKEAFRIIDPYGTNFVEMNVLKRLLLQLPGVDSVRGNREKIFTQSFL